MVQSPIENAQSENPRCKVRKDSVKFIDASITATPEVLADLSEEGRRFYFEHVLELFDARGR